MSHSLLTSVLSRVSGGVHLGFSECYDPTTVVMHTGFWGGGRVESFMEHVVLPIKLPFFSLNIPSSA